MKHNCNNCKVCFLSTIKKHLLSYPLTVATINSDEQVPAISELIIRTSQVEEILSKLLSTRLIEMRYSNIKFSKESFNLIDKKFSLWRTFYNELVLYHKYLVSSNLHCPYYTDYICTLAEEVYNLQKSMIKSNDSKVYKIFLNTHSKVYDWFVNKIKVLKMNGYPTLSENIFNIGRWLIIALDTSIAEILTADSVAKDGLNTIFITDRCIRLDFNYVEHMYKSIVKIGSFYVKYFSLNPVVSAIILQQIKEAGLENKYLGGL